jgi:hypothetical protein
MSDDSHANRTTAAIPNQIRDAMIVPDARVPLPTTQNRFTALQQNWIFAQQWKTADSAARNVVELRLGAGAADYLAAIEKASQRARGKEVILAVGHGGAGGFRGLTQTVFDAIPNAAEGLEKHPFAITRQVLELPDVAEKIDGRWMPRAIKDPRTGVIARESQGSVDQLSPRFDMLAASGGILRAAGVARFVVLACNLGKDVPPAGKKGFLDLLAGVLGVDVVAYRGLVAIGEVTFTSQGASATTKEQIWIALDETDANRGRPPQDDPAHASFHDVPLTARVTASAPSAPPAPTRGQR